MRSDKVGPPFITIVLPTCNRAHLIGRAIGSVLAQSHHDLELLVVDDGSSDGTREIVAGFEDPRIRYLRNEHPRGPAAARNDGIKAAGPSRYLAFIDDDDEWLPAKLERQLAVFDQGPPDLAAVGCGRIDYDGRQEIQLPNLRGFLFEDLLARRARGYGGALVLVRRFPGEPDLLFDESLPCLEDADYTLRLARNRPLDFVPEPLVKVYRDHGGVHVWNPEGMVAGYDRMAQKYSAELATRPWVRSYYNYYAARGLAQLGRWRECRVRLWLAMHDARPRGPLAAWYFASYLGRRGLRLALMLFPIAPPFAP
jgi:glycosyltransferase involved in cell wall biosynthesis